MIANIKRYAMRNIKLKPMAQQTAVDFIIENLPQIDWDDPFYIGLLQQAKAMQKEQIMKTARQCHFEGVRQSAKTSEEYIMYGEQYYNETYNK